MQIAEKLLIIWTWAAVLEGRTADWSAAMPDVGGVSDELLMPRKIDR